MLEFLDAAYQFFPADPSPFVIGATRQANRFAILRGGNHRVRKIDLSGKVDRVKKLRDSDARLLFVANHPSHSDPQFMTEIQRRLGITSSFMAAYDVFLRSERQAWFMQKLGCFSIDREGSDRKAMAAAIDTLKQGEMDLTIFPEGNVYLMNDRVTPFLDGTSFIATKAHQSLKGEAEVWVIPISFKFTQLDNIREAVWQRLGKLANDSGYRGLRDPSDPEETVLKVGEHILSRFLQEKTDIEGDFDFVGLSADELQERLFGISNRLIGKLENELDLDQNAEVFIVDRVRKVRSRLRQIRLDEALVNQYGSDKISCMSDRAILCFRLLAYVLPYFKEKQTLDRYAETVDRLCEDFYSRPFPPLGRRKAMAKIGMPVSMKKMLDEAGGKTRTVVPELTQLLEKRIQEGVDDLNRRNKATGISFITTLES